MKLGCPYSKPLSTNPMTTPLPRNAEGRIRRHEFWRHLFPHSLHRGLHVTGVPFFLIYFRNQERRPRRSYQGNTCGSKFSHHNPDFHTRGLKLRPAIGTVEMKKHRDQSLRRSSSSIPRTLTMAVPALTAAASSRGKILMEGDSAACPHRRGNKQRQQYYRFFHIFNL